MKFELHSDGIVYIRNDDGSTAYEEQRAAFESDYGQPILLPTLPTLVSLSYVQATGVLVYYDAMGCAFPVEGNLSWAYGDGVLAALSTLLAKQSARLNPPPTLAQVQAAKIVQLSVACGAQITGGFSSSALGAAYTYPSKQTDQDNLAASVLASLLPSGQVAIWTTPFMCEDATGKWARRPHTAAQIQQVGTDGKAFVLACLTKLDGLRAQVAAGTDVQTVQAITW